jgi:hypothetical protein
MEGSRLFPIVGEPARDFYAGSLPEGCQALITLVLPREMVLAVFDTDGNLLEVIRRTLPSPPVRSECEGYFSVDDAAFMAYLKEQFDFSPGMIRVKEFQLPRGELAVYHRPRLYQEFLKNPEGPEFNDDDRRDLPTVISEWDRSDLFVLEVGPCDFWLDQTGEVIAS